MILAISSELAQATVNYLAERPFREVAPLIAALTKLQPAVPVKSPAQPEVESDSQT